MLGGFGAIKAMQDSLKMNRAQKRTHRKSAKELSETHPARKRYKVLQNQTDPAKVAEVRDLIMAKRKFERKRNILFIAFLAVLGVSLLSLLIV